MGNNPVPHLLVEIEAGGFQDGFAPILRLIPREGVALVGVLDGLGGRWFAAFGGDGPVFLRAARSGDQVEVEAVDDPPPAALANLLWMLSRGSAEDFELEVEFDPGE